MRTIASFSFIIFLFIFFFHNISFASNINEEFRGIKWLTDKEILEKKGFEACTGLNFNCLSNPKDNLSLGNSKLDKIMYYFNNEDKFIGVKLEFKKRYSNPMKKFLQKNFGSPDNDGYNTDHNSMVYYWYLNNVDIIFIESDSLMVKYVNKKADTGGEF